LLGPQKTALTSIFFEKKKALTINIPEISKTKNENNKNKNNETTKKATPKQGGPGD
tara:strand:- start:683 stop:850 length:168 start_codon:yes stop_codon:yes gene_type:complete